MIEKNMTAYAMVSRAGVRRNVVRPTVQSLHEANLVITRKDNELFIWKDRYGGNSYTVPAEHAERLIALHAEAARGPMSDALWDRFLVEYASHRDGRNPR